MPIRLSSVHGSSPLSTVRRRDVHIKTISTFIPVPTPFSQHEHPKSGSLLLSVRLCSSVTMPEDFTWGCAWTVPGRTRAGGGRARCGEMCSSSIKECGRWNLTYADHINHRENAHRADAEWLFKSISEPRCHTVSLNDEICSPGSRASCTATRLGNPRQVLCAIPSWSMNIDTGGEGRQRR